MIISRNQFYKLFFYIVSWSLLAYLAVTLVFDFYGLRIVGNKTPSLKGTLYLVQESTIPAKGELALIIPPATANLNYGDYLLKYIKGIEGDRVFVNQDNQLYINDQMMGVVKYHSKDKRISLEKISNGEIGLNQYFVWTPHVDSFDSRYKRVGLIDEKNIVGRAIKLI